MCEEASGEDRKATGPPALHKTTIVIWSPFPGDRVELEQFAREASTGEAYCSRYRSEAIRDPAGDPHWDGTDFFNPEVE
jgi:hypothetical protein